MSVQDFNCTTEHKTPKEMAQLRYPRHARTQSDLRLRRGNRGSIFNAFVLYYCYHHTYLECSDSRLLIKNFSFFLTVSEYATSSNRLSRYAPIPAPLFLSLTIHLPSRKGSDTESCLRLHFFMFCVGQAILSFLISYIYSIR